MTTSLKSTRAAAVLAGGLMLAPTVVLMRLPLLASEAREVNPWRMETVRAASEKSAALAEGLFAAQLSLALSASRFWWEVAAGRTPSLLNGMAVQRAMHAALAPSSKRVRTNYNRLRRRSAAAS